MNKHVWMATIGLLLGTIVLSLLSPQARAEGLRLGLMPESHHWIEGDHNERHRGLIAEYKVDTTNYFGTVHYNNSEGNTSLGVYYGQEFPVTNRVSWGYQLGGVSGYRLPITPLGGLTASYSVGPIKSRLLIIPAVVVGYQFLYEFE